MQVFELLTENKGLNRDPAHGGFALHLQMLQALYMLQNHRLELSSLMAVHSDLNILKYS